MNREDREALAKMMMVRPHLQALIDTLNAIVNEDDPGAIASYIDTMQEHENNMDAIWGGGQCIKDSIRNGLGDYAKIQEKCVRLGVV